MVIRGYLASIGFCHSMHLDSCTATNYKQSIDRRIVQSNSHLVLSFDLLMQSSHSFFSFILLIQCQIATASQLHHTIVQNLPTSHTSSSSTSIGTIGRKLCCTYWVKASMRPDEAGEESEDDRALDAGAADACAASNPGIGE